MMKKGTLNLIMAATNVGKSLFRPNGRLKEIHTKVLLKYMDEFRVFKSCQEPPKRWRDLAEGEEEPWYPYYKDGDTWSSGYARGIVVDGKLVLEIGEHLVGEDELRAELATREHVPNKNERRKIRQEKAKSQKNK